MTLASLHWAQPGWFLACLLLPLVWFVPAHAYRAWVHCLIRSGVLLLVILGLAQPQWLRAESVGHVVHVVDHSASIAAGQGDAADAKVQAALRALPDSVRQHVLRVDGAEGSDSPLGRVLAAALDRVPEGESGAVVLWSDGATTEREEARLLASLAARGVPVHTVALQTRRAGTRVVGFDLLDDPIQGRSTPVRVVVDQSEPAGGRVVIQQDGEVLGSQALPTEPGRHALVCAVEPAAAGFVQWDARIEGAGEANDRARLSRTVVVQAPLRVRYVRGGITGGAAQWDRLLGHGAQVEPVDASALGELDLSRTDVLVLDDVPASQVDAATQGKLMRAVQQDGLGLLVTGGRGSFGPGGWHDAPLATVMPVEAVQKEEKRDPSTSLVLIIDTSGSMSGLRVQLAKETARLAIKRLLPHDKVGIVEFYGAKRWAAPLQPASNAIEIQRALNRLDAGGGTVIMPAIEEAYYGLQNVDTRFKHVLVLTDGGVESGAFEPLIRKMTEKGINTSTVLCGPGAHSDFLIEISQWGKGRYYNVPDRFNLPEIIVKQPTTSRLPGYRTGTHTVRVRGGAGWWGSLDLSDMPPAQGYTETRARPGAEVLLEVDPTAHPLLASWRHGLGRVTTMTTEPVGPGAAAWSQWSPFGALLFRVLARTGRDAQPPFDIDLIPDGPRVRVQIRRRRGDGVPVLTEVGATEGPRTHALRTRSPDTWSATLRARPEALQVRVADAQGLVAHAVLDPLDVRVPEQQVDPAGHWDLGDLAASTGGTHTASVDAAPTTFALGRATAPHSLLSLRSWLWLFALALYLADIVWRRRP